MSSDKIYDVIIVGSGMTGGIASKILTELNLNVLMIERGRKIEHKKDYKTENIAVWDIPFGNSKKTLEIQEQQPVQSRSYAFDQTTKHFFINDKENPYKTVEGKPFDWLRGDHLGGKSVTWHRQSYRLSPYDIDAIKTDENGIEWPVKYADLEPWYDMIEEYIGVSGSLENLKQLPDGKFLKPFELNVAELALKKKFESQYSDRKLIIGRTAHLTAPRKHHEELGRMPCQSRNECQRGCSFGAYYSSLNSSIPEALQTGHLEIITDRAVRQVLYSDETKLATGVEVYNRKTGEVEHYRARAILMCASTIGTTQILLNSRSKRFPNGIGNDSGVLGHYLMDHTLGAGATGVLKGYSEFTDKGRRPCPSYIPRFQNLDSRTHPQFERGYAMILEAFKETWKRHTDGPSYGPKLKHTIESNGDWHIFMQGFGEMLPRYKNHISLDFADLDACGMPKVVFDCAYSDNEKAMQDSMQKEAAEMLMRAGCTDIVKYNDHAPPGRCIHEMGTARMGLDPATSFLNGNNQSHAVSNLFVTDGSCMPSSASQNPSLTYMALTARASFFIKKYLTEAA